MACVFHSLFPWLTRTHAHTLTRTHTRDGPAQRPGATTWQVPRGAGSVRDQAGQFTQSTLASIKTALVPRSVFDVTLNDAMRLEALTESPDNDKPLSKANEFAFVKRAVSPALLSLLTEVIRKNGGFRTEGLFRLASDAEVSGARTELQAKGGIVLVLPMHTLISPTTAHLSSLTTLTQPTTHPAVFFTTTPFSFSPSSSPPPSSSSSSSLLLLPAVCIPQDVGHFKEAIGAGDYRCLRGTSTATGGKPIAELKDVHVAANLIKIWLRCARVVTPAEHRVF